MVQEVWECMQGIGMNLIATVVFVSCVRHAYWMVLEWSF